MPSWTAEEIAAVLLACGFSMVRQGATSHAVFRHPDGRQVTLAMSRRDIAPGTLWAIRRQAGLPFRK